MGQKSTIIATLEDVEVKKVFSQTSVRQLTFVDSTGTCLLNLLNETFYKGDFEIGKNYVFSGMIETYDSEKCINNPLLKKFICTSNPEVVPVYAEDFSPALEDFEKKDFNKNLLGSDGVTLKDALLGLNCFLGKEKLVEARKALKLDELIRCHIACLESGTTLLEELIDPFKIDSYSEIESGLDLVIYPKDEGEEIQAIKDAAQRGNRVMIICPLASKTSDERNAKAYDFARAAKVPATKPHPFISIENEADCGGNDEGVTKRQAQMRNFFDNSVRHLITTSAGVKEKWDLNEDDLLVVEDADRISTLQIDLWRQKAKCRAIAVSNSKSAMQKQRLEFLMDAHPQKEVMMNELAFRRDGDILGCRNEKFQTLKLVNLTRDQLLCDMAEKIAKDMLKC